MYYDLCLNYDNPNNKNIEQYREFCELVTSAICGKNSLIQITTNYSV